MKLLKNQTTVCYVNQDLLHQCLLVLPNPSQVIHKQLIRGKVQLQKQKNLIKIKVLSIQKPCLLIKLIKSHQAKVAKEVKDHQAKSQKILFSTKVQNKRKFLKNLKVFQIFNQLLNLILLLFNQMKDKDQLQNRNKLLKQFHETIFHKSKAQQKK